MLGTGSRSVDPVTADVIVIACDWWTLAFVNTLDLLDNGDNHGCIEFKGPRGPNG